MNCNVIAERQACIDICTRFANLVIALGVTGDAVKMANDIADAIRERGMSIGISAALGAEVERLRRALQVIETWARFDAEHRRRNDAPVALNAQHVIDVCRKALGESK